MVETRYNLRIQQIQQRLKIATDVIDTGMSVVFDNDPAKLASKGTRVLCHISFGLRRKASIGSKNQKHRQFGEISVQIYADQGKGPKEAMLLYQEIDKAFRTRDSGMHYEPATPNILGLRDGAWRVNVAIAFFFDENLTVA